MSSDVTGHVPQAAVDSDHSRHDQLLVARLAAGDASEQEQPVAQALVDRCSDCAALAADLRLLSSALASLPQPARSRDFRLTQEQADRLRGGLLQRLMRALGGPAATVVRPLAGAAMTIGITLAVLGSALGAYAPGAVSAPALDQAATGSVPALAPAASQVPANPEVQTRTTAPQPNASGVASPPVAAMASAKSPPSTVEPNNYNDASSAPPPPSSAGSAGGGQSGEVPGTPGLPPTSSAAIGVVATSSPGAQLNPIPPTQESATPATTSTALREALMVGGGVLAALGLAALLLVAYARRRFRDPLIR